MEAGVLEFDGFRIDKLNAELRRGDNPIPLAPKPFAVLCHLIEHRGGLVTKEALLDAVWPNLHVSESSLTFAINAVRAALGDDAKTSRYIQTVPRRGYRFVADLSPAAGPASASARRTEDQRDRPVAPTQGQWRVGRAEALRFLDESLRKASRGERQVVFITGEGGIGKTTLIDMAVSRWSGAGTGVLRGRCTELFGTDEAFLPLIEALQQRCSGADGAAVLRVLRDHAPTWVAQMPGFLSADDQAKIQLTVRGATRERMLREFCEFMEALSADRPWVLVVEDLHWSDPATVDVLSRLARRDRRAAVLVLATYRPADVAIDAHPIRSVHQDLRIHRLSTDLALDRLSQADVEAYLRLRFENAPMCLGLAERVFRRTGGQPLFVISLIDYFVARQFICKTDGQWSLTDDAAISQPGLPQDLREMISRQINRLGDAEQRILEVASAAGAEFAAALVARAMRLPELEVEQICETLARKNQILMAAGVSEWPDGTVSGRYMFQHDLHQEVLYHRLAPGQRVQTHRLLGEVLEAGHESGTSAVASVLATHFEAGRTPAKAIQYLVAAATSSVNRFGGVEAVNYLTRALDLLENRPGTDSEITRMDLLRRRGWVRRDIGDFSGAVTDLVAMTESAARSGELRQEINGLLDLSRFCLHADRNLALKAGEQAAARSEALNDPVFRTMTQGACASARLYLLGWHEDGARKCRTAITVAEMAEEPDVLVRGHGIRAVLACLSADYRLCLQAAGVAAAKSLEAGDSYMALMYKNLGLIAALQLGLWRRMRGEMQAALAMAETNANRLAATMYRLMIAWFHLEIQDYQGAMAACEQASHPVLNDIPPFFFLRRIILSKASVGLGEHATAGTLIGEMVTRLEHNATGITYTTMALLHVSHCEYLLATGDLRGARLQADRLHDLASPAPDRNYLSIAHWYRGRIAMVAGDVTDAYAHLSRALALLEQAELPHAALRIYPTAAAVFEQTGDLDKAADLRRRHERLTAVLSENFDEDDPLRAIVLSVR